MYRHSDRFTIAASLGYIWSRLAFSKCPNYWKIAGLTPGNFKDLIIVAQLHLSQGTISTRLPFHDRMVGVITLNLQKKCILVAKKGCNLQWQISYALLFFEKNFLFLDQFFLFFDLDCQNLTAFGFDNHPDLKKERIDRGKEKVSLRKETAHASFAISVQRFSSY